MKKLLTVLLSILIFILPLTVLSDSSWLAVPSYYKMWADMYYKVETDDEITVPGRNSENLTLTKMDKITTFTDPKTMNVVKLSIIYYDTNVTYTDKMNTDRLNRALSFFSAIEGGNFLNLSEAERSVAEKISIDIVTAIDNLTDAQYEDIWKGAYVELYVSDKGAYYIHLEYNSRYVIYFMPK